MRASIEALGIKREVKLATKLTVDEVLTEINTNRVALRVPEAPGAEGPVKVKPTAPAATPPGDAKPAAPAATPPVKTKPAAPAATPPNTSPTGPVRMMHKQRSWFGRMLDWFRQRGRRGERGRGRDGS